MKSRMRGTAVKRFWSRVVKTDSCWTFTSYLRKGYGAFRVGERKMLAHRFSYELHFGPIPDGLLVCHKCDVRDCVNPDHLFVGTQSDNLLDASAKGRLKNRRTRGPGTSPRPPRIRRTRPVASSGHPNVYWREDRRKYQVKVMVNRKNVTLGNYADLNEAIIVAENARKGPNLTENEMNYVQCRTHGQRIGYPAALRGECDVCHRVRIHKLKGLVADSAGTPYQREVEDDLARETARAASFEPTTA